MKKIESVNHKKGFLKDKMEKKFKLSDKSMISKIVYLAVIAVLCISAIIIGVVAAASRKTTEVPPVEDGTGNNGGTDSGDGSTDSGTEDEKPTVSEPTFISPVAGTVIKSHSTTVPAFSETLEEWRIHTGIDISCEESAEVMAASGGEITRVYSDPMLGKCVEITHDGGYKTVYANLEEGSVKLVVGDTVDGGAVIGKVGYSAISEIADEAHLHFLMSKDGVTLNPLDRIEKESLRSDLGIVS